MDNEARERYAAVVKAVDNVMEALKAVDEAGASLRARAMTLHALMVWAKIHMEDDD